MLSIIHLLDPINASLSLLIENTRHNLPILWIILALPWGIFFLNAGCQQALFVFGLIPRRARGLAGILFSPLLHANFDHLFFNSIPLLVLSNFLLMHGVFDYLIITLFITVFAGLLIWCFAPSGLYVGASALITGYWGFLVCNMYHEGTVTAIILGLVSLYYFSGILYGLFPSSKEVSWQGHVFGLLAGIFTCLLLY